MESGSGVLGWLEGAFAAGIVSPIAAVLFWDVVFWDNGAPNEIQLPVVVLWLVLGAPSSRCASSS